MNRFARALCITVGLAAANHATATSALADSPPLFTMPDVYQPATVGGELVIGTVLDSTAYSLEAFAAWPIARRWAISGRVPLVHFRNDLQDGTSLGNVTLGGSAWVLARARSRWLIDLSLSLPTASSSGDAGAAAATHELFRLPQDPGRFAGDVTTVRVAGDYRAERGRAFFQTELGLHVLIGGSRDDQTLLRLGLGAGIQSSSRVAFVAELMTMSDILDDSDGENFVHSLDLGLRVRTVSGTLGVRLYLPLDDSLRNGADILGLGLEYRAYLR